ncbi:hypothetical protein BsWGS_15470 [Bradybaena similaris]
MKRKLNCSDSAVWLAIGVSDTSSYTAVMIFQVITYSVVCQLVDVVGVSTNIINIICFIKQGFKDPVNVSLLGLAVADLLCLITLLWTNICMTPAFQALDLPFHAVELQHLTTCVMHTTFTRLSGWITALIIVERCLCITAPLKVKSIVTPKRVAVVVVCLFIILTSSVSPVYMVSRLDHKYFQDINKTLIGIVYTKNRESVEQVSYFINNVFIPFGSFIVIIICTAILVAKLHEKAKWRKKSAVSAQADNVSTRNQKVAKMMVMISTLFVACFFPHSVGFIAMALLPELSVGGKFNDLLLILAGICFLLESINSSANIFFYYRMSSKYRAAFCELLHISSVKHLHTVMHQSLRRSIWCDSGTIK